MTSLDDAIIARLKSHEHTFEIFVDPDKALAYKNGENVGLDEVLAAEQVFKDAGSADKASEELMKQVFGSSDVNVVAEQIIKKGRKFLNGEEEELLKKLMQIGKTSKG